MGLFDGNVTKERIQGLPSWILTPLEEKEVLEEYQKEVWRKCDDQVKAFRKCESLAGFGVFYKCSEEAKAMRKCVHDQHDQEYVDEIRDAFIKKKMERIKKEQEEAQKN